MILAAVGCKPPGRKPDQHHRRADQSGAERYSTEIVLQNFNSAMVLLDGREGGSGGGGGRGGSDYGNEFGGGGGGGGAGGGSRPQSRPQPAAFDTDLDDDVPF